MKRTRPLKNEALHLTKSVSDNSLCRTGSSECTVSSLVDCQTQGRRPSTAGNVKQKDACFSTISEATVFLSEFVSALKKQTDVRHNSSSSSMSATEEKVGDMQHQKQAGAHNKIARPTSSKTLEECIADWHMGRPSEPPEVLKVSKNSKRIMYSDNPCRPTSQTTDADLSTVSSSSSALTNSTEYDSFDYERGRGKPIEELMKEGLINDSYWHKSSDSDVVCNKGLQYTLPTSKIIHPAACSETSVTYAGKEGQTLFILSQRGFNSAVHLTTSNSVSSVTETSYTSSTCAGHIHQNTETYSNELTYDESFTEASTNASFSYKTSKISMDSLTPVSLGQANHHLPRSKSAPVTTKGILFVKPAAETGYCVLTDNEGERGEDNRSQESKKAARTTQQSLENLIKTPTATEACANVDTNAAVPEDHLATSAATKPSMNVNTVEAVHGDHLSTSLTDETSTDVDTKVESRGGHLTQVKSEEPFTSDANSYCSEASKFHGMPETAEYQCKREDCQCHKENVLVGKESFDINWKSLSQNSLRQFHARRLRQSMDMTEPFSKQDLDSNSDSDSDTSGYRLAWYKFDKPKSVKTIKKSDNYLVKNETATLPRPAEVAPRKSKYRPSLRFWKNRKET